MNRQGDLKDILVAISHIKYRISFSFLKQIRDPLKFLGVQVFSFRVRHPPPPAPPLYFAHWS